MSPSPGPGITVVIACHNAAGTIARAVRSALLQDPAPAEVVVCDDASDDDSVEVLAGFGPRVRVLRHAQNRGEAGAKNTAVRAARTEWVAVLDADDEFLPGRLAAVAGLLADRPGLDLVTTDAYLSHDGRRLGRWYGPHYPFAFEDQRRAILERNFVFGHVVLRRSAFLAVGGFDERIAHATDWDCWIRMVHTGSRIGLVPEPLAVYHLQETSLSSDRPAMARSIAALLTEACDRLELTVRERRTALAAAAQHTRTAARHELKRALLDPAGDPRAAARAVLADREQAPRSRALAAAAYALPSVVRRRLQARERTTWLGPGDVRLPRRLPAAGQDRDRRLSVLLTVPDRPWPANGGKRMRASATLRALAALPEVDLDVVVLFAGPPVAQPLPPGVRARRCVQHDGPLRPKPVAAVVALTRAVPWQVAVPRWGSARRAMAPLRSTTYDLVWFGATDHALSLQRAVRARHRVIDMDDVETSKARTFLCLPADTPVTRGLVRLQRRIELPLWWHVQQRASQQADALVVCSELDRRRLRTPRAAVVPNVYPYPAPGYVRRPDGRPTLLMIGTYSYLPNVDAAAFAARQVLPLLREKVPDARLRLVGRFAEELLADLGGLPGVDVVGEVPDVGPELSRAALALATIRYGGGTRIKILEAFAHEVPVVSTPLAREGLSVVDGRHLLVGDDPAELADACVRVLDDPTLARELGRAGRDLHAERYAPEASAAAVREVLARFLPVGPHDAPGPR
ncbi:glycosyltransferase [Motilibacter aurantiacus]|uniref:glycosyltransferase n=1 Tax=Motilibacter aurantiacus TaxID=2714955 RepID=UPI001408D576|nr:glycosyltransferase [Motilibacter aurantiacus]NHC45252.1 glycosyltransferase [Motilibacter aurantiacus]